MNIYNNIEKSNNLAIIDLDNKEQVTYNQLLKRIEELDNKYKPEGVIIIFLKKCIDLIAWQLLANKLNLPFINIEDEVRLGQLDFNHYTLVNENEVKIINNGKNNIPEETKYIIFTSGSTGKPKQIYLKDEGVVKVVKKQADILNIERFLWLLNSTFDASLSDIYSTLLSGKILYVTNIKPNKVKTICEIIKKHKITHTDLPPVVLPYFLKQNNILNGTKIIIGGELVNKEIFKKFKNVEFYNAYGPSETTICCYLDKMDEIDRISDYFKDFHSQISFEKYGIEKINENLYELIIFGNVALGYNEEKLNYKFIEINHERAFMSGDLVSIKENSKGKYLAYVGRKDRQFKYNGKLISPEEIEKIAMDHGATHAKIKFNEKIHLHYQGILDINKFYSEIPLYMKPILLHKMEEISVNSNWKLK